MTDFENKSYKVFTKATVKKSAVLYVTSYKNNLQLVDYFLKKVSFENLANQLV